MYTFTTKRLAVTRELMRGKMWTLITTNMGRASISSSPITIILLRMKLGTASLAEFTAVSTSVN